MGSCIICGTSTEGHICDIHEEDAVFEFEGTRADQLTPGRFYRGSVDGFADFGVFVDIGERVTGLLHRSELDRRLESLDWGSGDTVYVQVTGVHDNGNVDLAWSIRQADGEFRGTLIDAPDGDRQADDADAETGVVREDEAGNARRAAEDGAAAPGTDVGGTDTGSADETAAETAGADAAGAADSSATTHTTNAADTADADATSTAAGTNTTDAGSEASTDAESIDTEASTNTGTSTIAGGGTTAVSHERATERSTAADLEEQMGETVRIEGVVADVYQTGGPTIFEIRDESATVDCAAFEEAGVRAYPAVNEGDVVRLDGVVEQRDGDVQVETTALVVLEDDERADIEARLDDAIDARAAVEDVPLLAETPELDAAREAIGAVATAIRRAVFDDRPVLVKHSATADGYVAGAAIERAVLGLVREHHERSDATYHYVDRRPLEDEYDMNEATGDVTRILTNRERHGERLPLVVFADCGGTRDSRDGFDLLSIYDVSRAVIDAGADPEVADSVDALVGTRQADGDDSAPEADDGGDSVPTSGTLAASVALAANPDVETDLTHLPAVSSRAATGAVPEGYTESATEAGYDEAAVQQIGEALSLIAYYQSYDDKRELVADLVFDRPELAEPIAARYREGVDVALDTADANADEREIEGVSFTVLDTAAFTNGFDFPPAGVLLDELHRCRVSEDEREHDGDESPPIVTVGFGEDELRYRSTHPIDDRAVAAAARESSNGESLSVRGGSDARFEFLVGEREAVSEALLGAIAAGLSE